MKFGWICIDLIDHKFGGGGERDSVERLNALMPDSSVFLLFLRTDMTQRLFFKQKYLSNIAGVFILLFLQTGLLCFI